MKTVWGAPEAEFETKSPVVVRNRSYDRCHVKRKNQAGVEDVGCWLRACSRQKHSLLIIPAEPASFSSAVWPAELKKPT